MRRLIDNDLLTFMSRLTVGIIFIVASVYKIITPGDFARSIWYYHIVPGDFINLLALVLPWVELVCGLFLILGIYYKGTIILINLMTFIFITALSSTLVRGIDIDCGCFKASKESGDAAWQALLFDLAFILLTLQLLFSRSRRWHLRKD